MKEPTEELSHSVNTPKANDGEPAASWDTPYPEGMDKEAVYRPTEYHNSCPAASMVGGVHSMTHIVNEELIP